MLTPHDPSHEGCGERMRKTGNGEARDGQHKAGRKEKETGRKQKAGKRSQSLYTSLHLPIARFGGDYVKSSKSSNSSTTTPKSISVTVALPVVAETH